MHSALGARNVLFLAPLHSLQLRVYCDVDFICRFTGLPHSRIKLFLSSAYISVHLRFQFVFIADIHDTEGITIRDMKTIRSNPVAEASSGNGLLCQTGTSL